MAAHDAPLDGGPVLAWARATAPHALPRDVFEPDARIGPVPAIGASHGIACPRLARLAAMIHECARGERPVSDSNPLELAA